MYQAARDVNPDVHNLKTSSDQFWKLTASGRLKFNADVALFADAGFTVLALLIVILR